MPANTPEPSLVILLLPRSKAPVHAAALQTGLRVRVPSNERKKSQSDPAHLVSCNTRKPVTFLRAGVHACIVKFSCLLFWVQWGLSKAATTGHKVKLIVRDCTNCGKFNWKDYATTIMLGFSQPANLHEVHCRYMTCCLPCHSRHVHHGCCRDDATSRQIHSSPDALPCHSSWLHSSI